ncbi:unnamed protein product [Scytosiphon promiscuus]
MHTTSLPGATRYSYKSTPPPTPPSACSPCLSAPEGAADMASPRGRGKGIIAPTTAVDDIAEKFGRPRAKSLSRHDISLPAWEEEGAREGAAAAAAASLDPPPRALRLQDRRRTVSMSVAEDYRRGTPNHQALSLTKQCLECHLPPAYAVEGEPAIFCRAHQMEGMVNVLRKGCSMRGCYKTPSYGFQGEGRQRCFSHMEDGMVHILPEAPAAPTTRSSHETKSDNETQEVQPF